tara:strand:+ start:163 stop:399 length:237 start_codon:yes stop_codon:yes gene_type:complete
MYDQIVWGILFGFVWVGVHFIMKHWWLIVRYFSQFVITFVLWSVVKVWYMVQVEGGAQQFWDQVQAGMPSIYERFNQL